jgi:deoxyribose-phosphate aldolase
MEKKLDAELAAKIEHTLLRPDAKLSEIKKLCEEAKEYAFAAVCVPPYFVKAAVDLLAKTKVRVATVVGFPLGYTYTLVKVDEAKKAIEEGADEVDMVMNIAGLKEKNYKYVQDDIQSVATIAHLHDKMVKVIIEVSLLSNEEIKKACEIAKAAGVDFVKTSTGFTGTGATVESVKLIRASLPKKIKVKAAGGIRDREAALELVNAGADRIGTSAGVQIVKG